MRVKICGIACEEDARAAEAAGADAVGCLVALSHPSPDRVDTRTARAIFASLPPLVARVLVTHRATPDEIARLVRETAPTTVQLHGPFPLVEIPALRIRFPFLTILKTVHVVDGGAVDEARRAAEVADAVLLDTRTGDRIGGTGRTHDWSISARIVRTCPRPVVLAGGLTPDNVGEAIRRVVPWGVDVNSGVRGTGARKSEARLRSFIAAARRAGEEGASPLNSEGGTERW